MSDAASPASGRAEHEVRSPERAGKGSTAVRAQKRPRLSDGAPWQKLELFPTPPWATRALFERVLPVLGISELGEQSVWEPAAGLGHMSEVLADYFAEVRASDVFNYDLIRAGIDTTAVDIFPHDFLGHADLALETDWIITNPPFGKGVEFVERALSRARAGVALLLRLQWLETEARYRIFEKLPPTLVAIFSERVAMCEGGWDPACDTATAYAWFVWKMDAQFSNGIAPPFSGGFLSAAALATATPPVMLDTLLIPAGCKQALTRPSDAKLASRCVPGFVPPSVIKKAGKAQARMSFDRAPLETSAALDA